MHVEHPLLPTPYSQASTALLAVIYLYMVGVFVAFGLRRGYLPKEERWGITAVAVCVPLLAVRLAYTLIFMITADRDFNAIKGNPTAYLVMTMLPEVAIIATCTYIIQAKIPLSHHHNRSHQKLGTEDGDGNYWFGRAENPRGIV
jgi:hypothetical protein